MAVKAQIRLAYERDQIAQETYREKYNQELCVQAVETLSLKATIALKDEALALCGSPYHAISARNWGKHAQAFLELFAYEQPQPIAQEPEHKRGMFHNAQDFANDIRKRLNL